MPWTKVYSNKDEFEKAASENQGLRGITYREAILEATAELLEEDPSFFVLGEGVDDSGGVFGTTKGLWQRFGKERVMDTPLAENGTTGIAVGAAVAGMRPLLVHMRVDFTPLSMDQLINHAAKWSYMFAGAARVPLTVRCIIGRGWGSAAQHSQSLHSLFANIPGLRVLMPATPYDAKGLLRAAVYDNNPCIIIEHRWLYEHMGHVPKEPYTVEIGKALVRRPGKDVTIAALSHMVFESVSAANLLQKEGISAEVIDLRSVKPLDSATVIESVKKTGRLITAEPGWRDSGTGAEVIARVSEEAFGYLKAPAVRITLPECPTPASHILEKAFYPSREDIAKAARKLVNG